ncbi:MAG TPA: type IV toxin-antitoxin system AbiEi family antitoxin domain-containing protein [Solirubrobacteraceae bacterium]|nr:type IV toxin-antitoxin system AbiEi family antitoxin domain-containing protein [Solirubrobacteraceae bacterium]
MGDSERKAAQNGPDLAQSAARQEGVVSREQLRQLGLSRKQIARMERNGDLHEIYHDVFAVGHRNISRLGHLIAAVMSCGPGSFLSHRTAAAVHGLRAINVRAIEMTVVVGRAPAREGLIVHRAAQAPAAGEIRTRGLLRFSSVPRMFVEVAAGERDTELDRLITLAVRKRLLDPQAMEAALERHERRPGVARLREALGRYLPQPDRTSDLERDFDAWLLRHPEIPEPRRNIHIGRWEIDCWWPEQKVALELDGRPYHVAVNDMERDRIKDTKLQRMGIKPMRVTDFRFEHDPRGVGEDLMALLQLG